MRYRIFKKKKDGLFYFQFLSNNDQAILNSQGYQAKDARNNGIRSVLENAGNADRYERKSDDGNHYFILKAKNGIEIGRSVNYDSETAMNAVIQSMILEGGASTGPSIGGDEKAAPKKEAAAKPAAVVDDNPYDGKDGDDNYRRLSFYESNIEGSKDGFNSFAEGSNFYFAYGVDDSIVLISESYSTESGRDNGQNSVDKNKSNADRYDRKVHPNGKHYFNLKAGNNQEIATSRWFDNLGEMNRVIGILTGSSGGGSGTIKAATEATAITATASTTSEEPPKKKKRRKKREPKQDRVNLKSGDYMFNKVRWQTFQSKNAKYYYIFRDENEKSILFNSNIRGYNSESEVDEGLEYAMKWSPDKKNYEIKTAKNGTFYFYLKDGDGKNIGKSFFYKTEEEVNTQIGLMLGAAAAAAPAKKLDDYLECAAYAGGDGGFFKFDSDGESYFAYNDENGKTYLRSEGYSSVKARDNGIESVIKNSPIDERWSKGADDDGRHYFALKAGNHQEIARSCNYNNEAEMNADYDWVRGEKSSIGAGAKLVGGAWMSAWAINKKEEDARLAAEAAARRKAEEEARLAAEAEAKAKAEEDARLAAEAKAKAEAEAKAKEEEKKKALRLDDYLPCETYNGGAGFHTFEHEGEHYFSYNDGDGSTMLRSEGYKSTAARDNGIESVMKNAKVEAHWSQESAMNDKYFFLKLKAGNHQEIARSCFYNSEAEMKAAWTKLQASSLIKEEEKITKEAAVVDDYLPCEAYNGGAGFHTFEHEGEHYFSYNDGDGSTMLRSEGYKSTAARDNGIESVKKNAKVEAHWSQESAMNDKYFFLKLKAGNHQEIARSCFYNSEAEMKAAWTKLQASSLIKEEEKVAKVAAASIDEYLPCEAYKGADGFHKFEHEGEHYFSYNNDKGEVILRSEGYKSTAARDNGIESVKKNSKIEKRWKKEKTDDGKYYYSLRAGNNQEIGRSCLHDEEKAMMAGWNWLWGSALVGAAVAAPVVAAKVPPPPPPPPPKPKPKPKPVVAAAAAAPVVETVVEKEEKKKGCAWWWWLLGLLLLLAALLYFFKGCEKETAPPPPPPPPAEVVEPAKEATPPPPAPAPKAVCNCSNATHPVFRVPSGAAPKALTKLGTFPEFGNSHGLDGAGFYNKIKGRYAASSTDKRFLDGIFKAMGYSGFGEATADLFSETTITSGIEANIGSGKKHKTVYRKLNLRGRDLQAFKIKAKNGCDLHFMKTCGNHMFFCPN